MCPLAKTCYPFPIDHLHNYCLGYRRGIRLRSVRRLHMISVFSTSKKLFSCLRFGLFWVWFIGFKSSKLKLEHCSSYYREYFRRKIGNSWTAREPSFLNGKCPYIVTSHSGHRVYPSVTVRFFGFGFGFWKLKLEHRSSERVLEKKKKKGTADCHSESQASWTKSISPSSPCIHTACTPPVPFQVQPERKKASWHKIRLHCNLFPLLSASFWEWMALSFGPDDGGGKHRAFSQSMRLGALYSHSGDMRAKREKNGTASATGKCPAGLQPSSVSKNWWLKSPQALRHAYEHESEHFLREDVRNAYNRAVGDAKVRSVSLTNGKKPALPELTWPRKTMREE